MPLPANLPAPLADVDRLLADVERAALAYAAGAQDPAAGVRPVGLGLSHRFDLIRYLMLAREAVESLTPRPAPEPPDAFTLGRRAARERHAGTADALLNAVLTKLQRPRPKSPKAASRRAAPTKGR